MTRAPLIIAALALMLSAPVARDRAAAQCPSPYLLLEADQRRPTIELLSTVTLEGRAFVDGCNDGGSATAWGCTTDEGEVETPRQDVVLRLRQGQRTWDLASADAGSAADNQLGHVSWTFSLPDQVRPGRATLLPDDGEPAEVRLVAPGNAPTD